jgi:hypothetical protein
MKEHVEAMASTVDIDLARVPFVNIMVKVGPKKNMAH